MKKERVIGNGHLELPAGFGKHFRVYGGPYTEKPKGVAGVKMAAEIAAREIAVDIPTRDFSVPTKDLLDKGLREAVELIVKGEPVYVGCMAGRGRTGLFLAVLAKAFGVPGPVEFVRANYYSHAVETQGQYLFVSGYEVPADVTARIASIRFWSWLNFFRKNLTREVKFS